MSAPWGCEGFDKAVKHRGGTEFVYFRQAGGDYEIVYPQDGTLVRVTRSHFEKMFLPCTSSFPPAIRKKLEEMPNYREWKEGRG